MPSISFTASLRRHLAAPPARVAGATVREALEEAFRANPPLRGYVLDDQGRLRRHVMVFVDGEPVRDRWGLVSAHLPPIHQVAFGRARPA